MQWIVSWHNTTLLASEKKAGWAARDKCVKKGRIHQQKQERTTSDLCTKNRHNQPKGTPSTAMTRQMTQHQHPYKCTFLLTIISIIYLQIYVQNASSIQVGLAELHANLPDQDIQPLHYYLPNRHNRPTIPSEAKDTNGNSQQSPPSKQVSLNHKLLQANYTCLYRFRRPYVQPSPRQQHSTQLRQQARVVANTTLGRPLRLHSTQPPLHRRQQAASKVRPCRPAPTQQPWHPHTAAPNNTTPCITTLLKTNCRPRCTHPTRVPNTHRKNLDAHESPSHRNKIHRKQNNHLRLLRQTCSATNSALHNKKSGQRPLPQYQRWHQPPKKVDAHSSKPRTPKNNQTCIHKGKNHRVATLATTQKSKNRDQQWAHWPDKHHMQKRRSSTHPDKTTKTPPKAMNNHSQQQPSKYKTHPQNPNQHPLTQKSLISPPLHTLRHIQDYLLSPHSSLPIVQSRLSTLPPIVHISTRADTNTHLQHPETKKKPQLTISSPLTHHHHRLALIELQI